MSGSTSGGVQGRLAKARNVAEAVEAAEQSVDMDDYSMDRELMHQINKVAPGGQVARFCASMVEGRIRKNGVFIITLAIEPSDKAQALRIGDFPGMALDVVVSRFNYETLKDA